MNSIKIPTKKAGDFELPVLGFGTWRIGGDHQRDPDYDAQNAIRVIRQALDTGVTHVDTAEMYGAGFAEEIIARAIKGYDRKKLFIVSKVLPRHLRYDDLINSAKASLKRLEIDRLDLYLIHAPNPTIPLSETMKAMDFLVDEGLVRYIGVSNFDSQLIEEAQSNAKHKIVNNQIHYNISAREYEENRTLEYCAKNEILITAYRPFGGSLRGAIDREALEGLKKKYGKTPAQIAINWVINKPNVVALFKTVNIEHLKENLGSIGWKLEPEDEKHVDAHQSGAEMVHGPNLNE